MGWFQKKTSSDKPGIDKTAVAEADNSASVHKRPPLYAHLEFVLANKQTKGVVLKLYIENFKHLNNVFGYDYCEQLLVMIISYLSEKTQSKVYRHIGVEFVVILEGYTQGQATALAEEIIEQFDHAWKINDTDCLCSVQIGLCSYANHDMGSQGLMKCLDIAITTAVERGPNQAVMFDSNLKMKFIRKQTIALQLKQALDQNLIEVRYRPTYHMESGRFTRAEFYMRIFIEGLGLVGAAEFIPIAEDSGQIRAVEYFALEQVGSCIADLLAAGKEFESISLPLSSILLLQNDFPDKIQEILHKYKIPKGKLAIELDESAFTTAYLHLNMVLQRLSETGVELILNDYGSGYGSISSIMDLPINTLKLERMFVWQLETNPKSVYLIGGLINIAKRLDLHIIAEGVETNQQISALGTFGCEYEQGFYYSPTLEKHVLKEILGTSLEESSALLRHEKEKMQDLMKR